VFKLYVMGAFRLEQDGAPLSLPTRKMEALVAYLALHPGEHTREKLAALFWGDSSDRYARHSLSVALNTLRKTLGQDFVLADRATIELNPAYKWLVDAKEISDFRFMISDSNHNPEQIINLKSEIINSHGDFLADFYDDWILQEREHYRIKYLDALLALVQQLRSNSEYERAIEIAQRILQIDPANERAHQHLMFLYVVTGERQKALAQYEQCRLALQQELGLDEPSPETVALYYWIRQADAPPALAARLTNLPLPLTSFIGRVQERHELKERLGRARLVTLTGAGGSGKTRFAIQAGMEALDAYRDGVWWVDLAPLNDPARVPSTVMRALGLTTVIHQSPEETLVNALRDEQRLLIFDNCEHLIDASARLVEYLLRNCPALVVLTTSREPLNLVGEIVYPVPTLTVPAPGPLSVTNLLMQYEAVRLFVERAQAVNSQFSLNDKNAAAVATICARLDGIPLAIELAAACTRTMSAAEIAVRLDDRFALLTRGERTALPRQQTLYALIDWSSNLLTEAERTLFQQLSVFAGGFTLDAVECICDGENYHLSNSPSLHHSITPSLHLLTRLVEKSLIVVMPQGETTRYRMLESILEFAREKWASAVNVAATRPEVQERHFNFFFEIARQTDVHAFEEQQHVWMTRLDVEIDNIRAALTWSLDTRGLYPFEASARADRGLEFFTTMWWFWMHYGHVDEAQEWLKRFLKASPEPTFARCRGFIFGATLYRMQGNVDQAAEMVRQGMETAQVLGDPLRIAWSWMELSGIQSERGDLPQAFASLNKALEGFEAANEITWANRTRFLTAELRILSGEWDVARTLLEQGVIWFRAQADPSHIAWGLDGLATLERVEGNLDTAFACASEALELKFRVMDKYGLIFAFDVMAQIAAAQHTDERAACLWGIADRLCEMQGVHFTPHQQRLYTSLLPTTREQLGEPTFATAWEQGREMTLAQAMTFALQKPIPPSSI
jgi:predicted ATPase/DNA-binding SARP family transcriptional activator